MLKMYRDGVSRSTSDEEERRRMERDQPVESRGCRGERRGSEMCSFLYLFRLHIGSVGGRSVPQPSALPHAPAKSIATKASFNHTIAARTKGEREAYVRMISSTVLC